MTEVNESETTESAELKTTEIRARRSFRLSRRAAVSSAPAPSAARKPWRTVGITVALAGLVATVALPAIGALMPSAEASSANNALTLQQVAQNGAQSFVAASSVSAGDVVRDGYSATTPDEIAKKKAEEAAIARAKAAAEAASIPASRMANIDLSMTAPGSGAVRFPLGGTPTYGDGFMSRGGAHQGVDMLIAGGTPIFASHAGTVVVSSESYWGYGVAVEVKGDVGGTTISTRYAHMTSGSRVVGVGDRVEAGQLIGLVGSTGRSTANHLHFEVRANGQLIDPNAWLSANLG